MIDPHLATICCFKSCKSRVPDFSSKSLLVILMFSFLIESFLLRGSNGLSMMVALGHCFLAEIPDSTIPFFWGILVKIACFRKNENILNTRIIGKF